MPGDFSAAAPFIVAATLLPGSELTIHGVGVNPTRTGLLDVLERMGARITALQPPQRGGEPVARPRGAIRGADRDRGRRPREVPRLVDELPLFALAAGLRARREPASEAQRSCA